MRNLLDVVYLAILAMLKAADGVVIRLLALPPATIISAISLAGLVSSLIFLRINTKWPLLRRHAITHSAMSIFLQAALAIILWQILMELIAIVAQPIPAWINIGIPLLFALVIGLVLVGILWRRERFSLNSVFQLLVVPLIALIVPFFDHASSLFKVFARLPR